MPEAATQLAATAQAACPPVQLREALTPAPGKMERVPPVEPLLLVVPQGEPLALQAV